VKLLAPLKGLVSPYLAVAGAAIAPYTVAIRVGLLVAATLAIVVWGWRITVWHGAYHDLDAAQAAEKQHAADLKDCTAATDAAGKAFDDALVLSQTVAAADRAAAAKTEEDLHARLKTADSAGRDLARRLHDYEVRQGGGPTAALAGAATVSVGARQDTGGDAGVGQATAQVFVACNSDAERLDGWRSWWAGVVKRWREAGLPIEGQP
jgi:hypothetical protein